MTVQELIDTLHSLNRPEAEVGYDVRWDGLDLLIGEDPDTGEAVFISKPEWQ